MAPYRLNVVIVCLLIFLTINLIIYWSTRTRLSEKLIHSGIKINSFNPPHIDLTFTTQIVQSSSLSILDNNIVLVQLSEPSQISATTIILSDGFHHLDILLLDELQNIEFYQAIDIASGTRSLKVNVLNQQYKSVENISVHLELVDYSHITYEYLTNRLGEVIFHYLPKHIKIHIEAVCIKTKHHAFAEIDTLNYQNITLVLRDMSALHYDEYDLSDEGYVTI
ncbi:unnamed protein product [Rotaria magnacalcarata]|uniref:Uncharacterized protein n=1 Tax=Rotaria magnacalcarata TaxID=392030 RepID=A0A817A9V8_9BILA|nr:unnamed protein product [Rotaria magnacalcarata]CAF2259994.1 unnamed protein product [Rotaria magnacalcarata]CAF3783292.1 unnamed protein product [Rotaria magnacalcarata]CAF3814564.1 unnamed protein product [Rotaria magnacalcarata]